MKSRQISAVTVAAIPIIMCFVRSIDQSVVSSDVSCGEQPRDSHPAEPRGFGWAGWVRWIVLALLVGPWSVSCQIAQKAAKASPAKLSPFLAGADDLDRDPTASPFHHVWRTADEALAEEASRVTTVYVAPVDMSYLRPPQTVWIRGMESDPKAKVPEADQLATQFRQTVISRLRVSDHFQLVGSPDEATLVLETALTELSPTQVAGNVVTTGVWLAYGTVGRASKMAVKTHGRIAFEARVRLGPDGPLVGALADQEQDKLTFLINLRDFQPWKHVRVAMDEWGGQLEKWLRTPRGTALTDSDSILLQPW